MENATPRLLTLIASALVVIGSTAAPAAADPARQALQRGDEELAVQIWKKRALKHDREAQWILGVLFETGQHGLEKSPQHAKKFFRRATTGNRPDAAFNRAMAHATGRAGFDQDLARAQEALIQATSSGHPEVLVRVGRCYAGTYWPECGMTLDYDRANALFSDATARGYLEGECAIAEMYEAGLGHTANPSEGARRRRQVAELGHRCGDLDGARRLYAKALRGETTYSVADAGPDQRAAINLPDVGAPSIPSLPETGGAPLYGEYYALVIGIDSYANLPQLQTAKTDARAVEKLLKDEYGFTTRLLTNATRADVLGALSRLRREMKPEDNLLIYYAGHGWLDDEAGEGFWLPADADQDDPSNWIANTDITRSLRAMQAKHVMIVSDSCYSGTLTRGLRMRSDPTQRYRAKMSRLRTRVALSSGGLEPVADSGGGSHSVFAKAFLDVLESNEAVLEGYDLFMQIRRPVALEANQSPEYGDIRNAQHGGGDFLFVRGGADSQ